MTRVAFEFPIALWLGLPLAAGVVAALAVALHRRRVPAARIAALAGLRGVVLVGLTLLAARPVWPKPEEPPGERRTVVLLVDRSESMALEDDGKAREVHALRFAREQLLPALKAEGLGSEAFLFAEDARPADGSELAEAVPDGRQTNLAAAISRAIQGASRPPLALIALTDGATTENGDNSRALGALLEARVPFVGIGFGSETGLRTVALRQAIAPPAAPAHQEFAVSAQIEATGAGELPGFDLVLLRDGQFREKKTVRPGKGSRNWLESFPVTEDKEGVHTYTVRLLPGADAGVKCVNDTVNASVRISGEKELRVLFAQGALSWNYKFINIALRGDPTLKLTGLSRTSKQSVYYQNVENASELAGGFPTRMEDLAPFRVVVLSSLKPSELTPVQQDLLARYCGEFGGGVLLLGGAETFDASWQGTRLEQLLPVKFASSPGPPAGSKPFRLKLTEEALRSPVFQVGDAGAGAAVWDRLPAFHGYGRVESAKPGARVWIEHSEDVGPHGRRILLASQPFGSGISAVFCVQNLWRWRLARDADPRPFDRFWQQLIRSLGEGRREDLVIRLPDQDLRPRSEVRAVVERRPDPKNAVEGPRPFLVRVEDGSKATVMERTIELAPSRSAEVTFRAEVPGVYALTVLDPIGSPLASRTVEIKETNVEFEHTARDMENLRQWASLSDGLALKAEDCRSAGELIKALRERAEEARKMPARPLPAGMNGWTLFSLLTCLAAEWGLRKTWDLA